MAGWDVPGLERVARKSAWRKMRARVSKNGKAPEEPPGLYANRSRFARVPTNVSGRA